MVFPIDFYVLNIQDATNIIYTIILLGKPFMKISHIKIYVHNGTLTMELDRESICFNIFEVMKYPNDVNSYYHIDVVYLCIEHVFELE